MARVTSRLQSEIRQTRPFPSARAEALVGLLRTTDVVRRQLAAVVEPHGITLQQYNVLRILRGAGSEGLPTLEIAARMIEVAPGVTRLLDRLEHKRLVRRQRCPQDRRQVLCWITPAGLELLGRLDAPVAAADEHTLGGLTPERIGLLVGLLDDLRGQLLARPRTPAAPAPPRPRKSPKRTGEREQR